MQEAGQGPGVPFLFTAMGSKSRPVRLLNRPQSGASLPRSEALPRLAGSIGSVAKIHPSYNRSFSLDFKVVVFERSHLQAALPC